MAHRRKNAWPRSRLANTLALAAAAALMAACGGSGGDDGGSAQNTTPAACSTRDVNNYLQSYFNEWYLWTSVSPKPAPGSYGSTSSYFDALLLGAGVLPGVPADRWSGWGSAADFERFFGEGRSMGFGLSVAGLEVQGRPDLPLLVRAVEEKSPAYAAGLRRGDEILSANGLAAATMIEQGDFSALSASTEGQGLTLVLRRGTEQPTVTLNAAVYELTPVPQHTVLPLADGRRVGYLVVKDMISQAAPGLAQAFAEFGAAGVQELVLDLRYNGGGLVSMGAWLASHVAAARTVGNTYARLEYNAAKVANNSLIRFGQPTVALNLNRVYVLTGPRTCSAAEQVISGLQPFVDVVVVGDNSCGKPVGFVPQDFCDNTYYVVNFQSLNAAGQGAYFDGFTPNCVGTDDAYQALGDPQENLLRVAMGHAVTGLCRPQASGAAPTARRSRLVIEPEERSGMLHR